MKNLVKCSNNPQRLFIVEVEVTINTGEQMYSRDKGYHFKIFINS